ncbi:ATP-binding protein [Gammaproteobacteria bacterium]|jgi:two-component system sensor histidine kinase RegB|nr:ATP-binding protein [Gammaproteobacteria bacterium]
MMAQSKFSEFLSYFILISSDGVSLGRQGLQRLLLLRTFVTASSVIAVLALHVLSEIEIPVIFIVYLLSGIVISVLFGYWRLATSKFVSNFELFCHILVDVFFLIALLLNTGGASNPLISYLLVLLALTATLLPQSYVNVFSVGGILIYTSFLLLDLSSDNKMAMSPENEVMTFQLHLVGMWVIFLVSAILISVLITRMVKAIKVRELNLAEARENELRNEQLVAIGTLAAGTAHALGTPLSTMAVLLTELDNLDAESLRASDIKSDISLLRQQVTRCKNSLTQLIRYYNKDNPEEVEEIPLKAFVEDIQDYIVNIHPASAIDFDFDSNTDEVVTSNLSVKHAVINIIENAIKAAHSNVNVSFHVTTDTPALFEISIKDDGPGIPSEVMEKLGDPFISSRKESMGLGIFLANAAIERLNGSIEMVNMKEGGALSIIRLPQTTQ